MDQEGLKRGSHQGPILGYGGYKEGYLGYNWYKGGGYLLLELDKAKDESIACKEDCMGGGFSSELSI